MKNKLSDLNNHLFEELERLNDESLTGRELYEEKMRANAMATVAQTIINNYDLSLKAIKNYHEYSNEAVPEILKIEKGSDSN